MMKKYLVLLFMFCFIFPVILQAYTPPRTSNGFELHKAGSTIEIRKGRVKPATVFTKGMLLHIDTGNWIEPAVTSDVDIIGVANQSLTVLQNPAAEWTEIEYVYAPDAVWRCSVTGYVDFTCDNTLGTNTTTVIVSGSLTATNNYYRYGLVYIYEGTNAGEIREAVTSTAATTQITVTDPLPAACDTTSKGLFIGPKDGTSLGGITQGRKGVEVDSTSLLIDVSQTLASEAGPLSIPMDMPLIKQLLKLGMLPCFIYHADYKRKDT